MGDVLSQSEIDNLLQALSSGEMDAEEMKNSSNEKQVKDYDNKVYETDNQVSYDPECQGFGDRMQYNECLCDR